MNDLRHSSVKLGRVLPPTAAPLLSRDIWNGVAGIFSGGCRRELEEGWRDYFRVRYLFPVSSGKAALTLILEALKKLSTAKEVIIPAYTCYSVPAAVVAAGLRIRLCDIDLVTLDYDYDQLKTLLSDRTLCVLASHLFGIPADVPRLAALCRSHKVFLVEDAAQAMGITHDGKWLGTMADVGLFSFGRGKNITCVSGGLILTNSDTVGEQLDRICASLPDPKLGAMITTIVAATIMMIFIHPELYWIPANLPFLKLGETIYPKSFPMQGLSRAQAGLLRRWRELLGRWSTARSVNVRYYEDNLGVCWAAIPELPYLRFPVLLEDSAVRDELLGRSHEAGLGLSCMYPLPVSEIVEIRDWFREESYPNAQAFAERHVTLPTHPLVTATDSGKIVRLVQSYQ